MANQPLTDDEQWRVAVRILIAIVRVQTEAPGSISPETLPKVLQDAAHERGQDGDYGAARLLDQWAALLAKPGGEWD
jgi:hypothetical protein